MDKIPYEKPVIVNLAAPAMCPPDCGIGNTFEPPSCTYGHHDHSEVEDE